MSEPLKIECPRSYALATTAVLWKDLVNNALPLALALIVDRNEILVGSVAIPGSTYTLSWGITWDADKAYKKKVTIEVADLFHMIHSISRVDVTVPKIDSGGGVMVDDYTQPTTYSSIISPYIDSDRTTEAAGQLRLVAIQSKAIAAATTNISTLLVSGNSQKFALD